jgi:hypothetical protein
MDMNWGILAGFDLDLESKGHLVHFYMKKTAKNDNENNERVKKKWKIRHFYVFYKWGPLSW